MRTLAHFSAVAGFAVLAGCARMGMHTPPHPLPVNCRAGDCTVTVTVTSCDPVQMSADREPLVVDRQYQGPIFWELAPASPYSFTANGIDIKQGIDQEFDGKDPKPKKFKWNNKHSNQKVYKYAITVARDGQKPCTWDPSIMN